MEYVLEMVNRGYINVYFLVIGLICMATFQIKPKTQLF